jgi:hypothetical protein
VTWEGGFRGRVHFVYWIYGVNGRCIYVGRTACPTQRRLQHNKSNPRMMSQASYFRMAGPYNIDDAARIEVEQQQLLQPPYNAPWKHAREARELRAENQRLRQLVDELTGVVEVVS